jgi:hypothetical protein
MGQMYLSAREHVVDRYSKFVRKYFIEMVHTSHLRFFIRLGFMYSLFILYSPITILYGNSIRSFF